MTSANEPTVSGTTSNSHHHQFVPTPNPGWPSLETCPCGAIRSGQTMMVPNNDGTALVTFPAPQPADKPYMGIGNPASLADAKEAAAAHRAGEDEYCSTCRGYAPFDADHPHAQPPAGELELTKIIEKFQLGIFIKVGDEFAPKQDNGSPERKRLLKLVGEATIAATEALQAIEAQIQQAMLRQHAYDVRKFNAKFEAAIKGASMLSEQELRERWND